MEKKIKSALNEQNIPPRTNEEAANALENITKEAEVISGYAAQKNDTALFSVGRVDHGEHTSGAITLVGALPNIVRIIAEAMAKDETIEKVVVLAVKMYPMVKLLGGGRLRKP